MLNNLFELKTNFKFNGRNIHTGNSISRGICDNLAIILRLFPDRFPNLKKEQISCVNLQITIYWKWIAFSNM